MYTRKSTEEGLDQEFNTLDAQREAAEAYIQSQAAEGWALLPQRYDDGGFTGGNLDRPELQRLLVDIRAGKADTVLCYKVDRLSRSLLDFAKVGGHPGPKHFKRQEEVAHRFHLAGGDRTAAPKMGEESYAEA
jgi:hypothetical protein